MEKFPLRTINLLRHYEKASLKGEIHFGEISRGT